MVDADDRARGLLRGCEIDDPVLDLQAREPLRLKEPAVRDALVGLTVEPIEHARARHNLLRAAGR